MRGLRGSEIRMGQARGYAATDETLPLSSGGAGLARRAWVPADGAVLAMAMQPMKSERAPDDEA